MQRHLKLNLENVQFENTQIVQFNYHTFVIGDSQLFVLNNDFSLTKIANPAISNLFFVGSGLIIFQTAAVFDGDDDKLYCFNMLDLSTKELTNVNIRSFWPSKIDKLCEQTQTGYRLSQKVLQKIFGEDLFEYLHSINEDLKSFLVQNGICSLDTCCSRIGSEIVIQSAFCELE